MANCVGRQVGSTTGCNGEGGELDLIPGLSPDDLFRIFWYCDHEDVLIGQTKPPNTTSPCCASFARSENAWSGPQVANTLHALAKRKRPTH